MGAMKSLAHDYALYLQRQAREQGDLDFDIDEVFRQIVNSEIDIPQSYVDMWVSRNSVFASENVVFDAETNSWKQQKRDSKGRFIKGFSDKTDTQLNDEYDDRLQEEQEKQSYYIDAANEESIYNEMIAPYYKYTDLDQDKQMSADEFSEFLSQAIMDDNFPEKLTDIYYFQYLQKVAESVPLGILEKLHDVMEMHLNIGQASGDEDIQILGGRGIFITDILLNLKQGQEMWSAETFEAVVGTLTRCPECDETLSGLYSLDNAYGTQDLVQSCKCGWYEVQTAYGAETFEADDFGDMEYILLIMLTDEQLEEEYGDFMRDEGVGRKELPQRLEDRYRTGEEAVYLREKYLEEEGEECESCGDTEAEGKTDKHGYFCNSCREEYPEDFDAETFESNTTVNNFWNTCHDNSFAALGRKIYYNCRLFASISSGLGVVSNPAGLYNKGKSQLRYTSAVKGFPLDALVAVSNQEKPSSISDWYEVLDKTNQQLTQQKNAESETDEEYTQAEINLMRYDLVEHELENSDYNFLYDVLLYGTPGWANMEDAEVVQKFRNIFER